MLVNHHCFGTDYNIGHAAVDGGFSWPNGLELLIKSIKVSALKSFTPVSLHLEYLLGCAEKGKFEIEVDHEVVYAPMRKDLKAVQQLWKDA